MMMTAKELQQDIVDLNLEELFGRQRALSIALREVTEEIKQRGQRQRYAMFLHEFGFGVGSAIAPDKDDDVEAYLYYAGHPTIIKDVFFVRDNDDVRGWVVDVMAGDRAIGSVKIGRILEMRQSYLDSQQSQK